MNQKNYRDYYIVLTTYTFSNLYHIDYDQKSASG
jgi:hypothetical protein